MKKVLLTVLVLSCAFICTLPVCAQDAAEGDGAATMQKANAAGPQKITLDFKDADIRNVLRILSDRSGVNIIAGEEVAGLVTIRLVDVPWEQALEVILKTYGYAYEKEENIIRVTTVENLQQEELSTEVFSLNYAKAEDVVGSIEEVLSERGRIRYDERTNLLIVKDLPTNLRNVAKVIKSLDSKTPQVLIEAKVIETTLDNDENLGINWTTEITATGASRPTTFPFKSDSPGGPYYPLTDPSGDDTGFQADGGRAFPYALVDDFSLGVLDFSSFQMVLEALDARTNTKVLSNPRIVTLNNKQAEIVVGETLSIPTFERNSTTGEIEITGYEERDTGIKLVVTPHVNPEGYIVVELVPEISALLQYDQLTTDISVPRFSTRNATTQVMIKDNQTVVIGGLIKETTVDYKSKIPYLGDIPVLGHMFKKKEKGVEKTDLLFFVTVKLIDDDEINQIADEAQKAVASMDSDEDE